tara:strand:- start:185 stop:520 length:336 start_codon:yes stop_codon:yes gene_type:complete
MSNFDNEQTSAAASEAAKPTNYRLPTNQTLQHAAKLSIVNDKPIMLDYWTKSVEKVVLIGVKGDGEKLLVKSEDEYTSPVAKVYKVDTDYIIETENSLYLVDAAISHKRIS